MSEAESHVYDLIYPSPVTLKEIASISVAFELWRTEIVKYNQRNTSNEFCLVEDIALKSIIPRLPSSIYEILAEYVAKCRLSIAKWLNYHYQAFEVFDSQLPSHNDILKDYHDFAYDWNGSIHYVHTAQRMMLCEHLGKEVKFKIACNYCFENDIREIWPSVSTKIKETDFSRFPLLVYWVCSLGNKLPEIPPEDDESIDEVMLDECRLYDWSSVEYFWNRIPSEKQTRKAIGFPMLQYETLVRFILPKLNKIQLEEFIVKRGCDLIFFLYEFTNYTDITYVLPTWLLIGNNIDESNFIRLIERLFQEDDFIDIAEQPLGPKNETFICCEIWKAAPHKLRQLAIKKLLANSELFETICTNFGFNPIQPREMRFLITVLLDSSIEERSEFWLKNWSHFIISARIEDLNGLMKLCFENENKIVEFKQNTMSKYENINQYCEKLLVNGYFEQLNDLLTFCHLDKQAKREFTQKLLQDKLLGEESISLIVLFSQAKKLNEFIINAFDNVELVSDFKNRLVLSPIIENYLFESIRLGYFIDVIKFVDTFVSADQALVPLKKRICQSLKDNLNAGNIWQLDADHLQKILIWCFENEDEVTKFKRSISVDDIIRNMVQREFSRDDVRVGSKMRCHSKFDKFLEWYCTSSDSEEVGKFKERFSNEMKMFSRREEEAFARIRNFWKNKILHQS